MGYKGDKGYGVGYIAPSPPIGNDKDGYTYFKGGPIEVIGEHMSTNFVPDAKRHLYVSLAKSGLRIVGYIFICAIPIAAAHVAGALLIISEIGGIIEELV